MLLASNYFTHLSTTFHPSPQVGAKGFTAAALQVKHCTIIPSQTMELAAKVEALSSANTGWHLEIWGLLLHLAIQMRPTHTQERTTQVLEIGPRTHSILAGLEMIIPTIQPYLRCTTTTQTTSTISVSNGNKLPWAQRTDGKHPAEVSGLKCVKQPVNLFNQKHLSQFTLQPGRPSSTT